ncbi:S1 family peptidase [Spirochaeta dissipatitropha]
MNYPVFIPEFHTYEGRINAGHCFCAADVNSSYILTCLHLFGPAGGLRTPIRPEDLPSSVYKYIIHDPETDHIIGTGSTPYSLINTFPLNPHASELDASGDIAILPVPEESDLKPMIIAQDAVKPGEEVRILGIDRYNIESVSIKQFPCIVLDVNMKYLILQPKKRIDIPGLSGAPIIDIQDKVIGMIVGGFRDTSGKNRIIGNPAMAILKYLP